MKTFGQIIKEARENRGLYLRQVGAALDMDQAIVSKLERGERQATRKQVFQFAEFYELDKEELLTVWLSDRVVYTLRDEDLAGKALKVAEAKVAYLTKPKVNREAVLTKLKTFFKKDARIAKAWVFGSFARNEHTPESDLDIMVDLNPEVKKFSYFDLLEIQFELEKSLGLKVDINFSDAIQDFAKKTAENEKIPLK